MLMNFSIITWWSKLDSGGAVLQSIVITSI